MLLRKFGQQQPEVDEHFQAAAAYWKEVYERHRLRPLTYQRRKNVALRWIDGLGLPPGGRILEVGCGAGVLAAALASAGHTVVAIDTVPAMVAMAWQQVIDAGVGARVALAVADAHALAFSPGCFDVVVALGVLPWLHSEALAIAEMHGVLKPGGYLLITADNEFRLDRLLDPISTPPLAPLRRMVKAAVRIVRRSERQRGIAAKRHRPTELDRLLSLFGMVKLRSETLGFGPLTLCGRAIFSDSFSLRIDGLLSALEERNFPGLKRTGAHYLALAQKPHLRTASAFAENSPAEGRHETPV